LGSEAKWIWLPLGVLAAFGLAFRTGPGTACSTRSSRSRPTCSRATWATASVLWVSRAKAPKPRTAPAQESENQRAVRRRRDVYPVTRAAETAFAGTMAARDR